MRILYISSLVFNKASSASIRNTGLISGLVTEGHHIDVYTINYPNEKVEEYLLNKVNKQVNILYAELNFLNKYIENNQKKLSATNNTNTFLTIIKKAVKPYLFFPDVDREWIKYTKKSIFTENYDVIISSSDTKTSHFVAEKILKYNKDAKWIQIWGDPWFTDVNITGNYFLKKLIKYFEKKMLNAADEVYYISELTMEESINKYKLASNVKYLGRSYLEKIYKEKIHSEDYFLFAYTGNINKDRNILNLIHAIELYNRNNHKKIKMEIYGHVENGEMFKSFDFVHLKGIVSLDTIYEVYAYSDILVFIDNGNENNTQIPGKIYDYFGTNLNILALLESLDSKMADFLNDTNRCIVQKNDMNISLDFLKNLPEENPLDEYSVKEIVKKINLNNTRELNE